jgi:arsenite oxidase small subunit
MVTRRGFVQLCTTLLAGLKAAPPAFATAPATAFARVKLVDQHNEVFPASKLQAGTSYLFYYPFLATPCFLLRLDRPTGAAAPLQTEDGREYRWQGGIGPRRDIVAYSAICAHKMTHPARSVSFINYRPETVAFRDHAQQTSHGAGLIYCCSDRSVFDAKAGARVLGGPAPQPLAAIQMEHDPAEDALFATGVHGGALFDRFFSEFGQRLVLEFGTVDIERPVTATARVMRLDEYCRNTILC